MTPDRVEIPLVIRYEKAKDKIRELEKRNAALEAALGVIVNENSESSASAQAMLDFLNETKTD